MNVDKQLERAYGLKSPAKSRAEYMRDYRARNPDYRERAKARQREKYWLDKEAREAELRGD